VEQDPLGKLCEGTINHRQPCGGHEESKGQPEHEEHDGGDGGETTKGGVREGGHAGGG
jgi:hypothetical protein